MRDLDASASSARAEAIATAEGSVVGALMLDASRAADVAELVKPADFLDRRIGAAYAAAIALSMRGEPVDVVTLASEMGEGSIDLAMRLSEWSATAANIEHHARMVRGFARARRLQGIAQQLATAAGSADPESVDEVAEHYAGQLLRGADASSHVEFVDIVEAIAQVVSDAQERRASNDTSTLGAPTGLVDLDDLTEGYPVGELTLVGAHSGHGKTAWCVWSGYRSAELSGRTTLYISVEVKAWHTARRVLSSLSGIDGRRVQNGHSLTHSDIDMLLQTVKRTHGRGRFLSYHRPGMGVDAVWQAVRRAKAMVGDRLGLVVVDYLQRLKPAQRGHRRDSETAQMAQELKDVADTYGVPVVAACQLNREQHKRASGAPPSIADIREGDGPVHESALVMFAHRPQLWDEGQPADLCEMHVAKQRNGQAPAMQRVKFEASSQRFSEWNTTGGGW